MLRIFRHFRVVDFLLVGLCIVLSIVQVWLDLRIPDYMSQITHIINANGVGLNTSSVWGICLEMIACAIGSLGVSIGVGLIAAFVGAGFSKRMRTLLYDKIDSFGMVEMDKFSTSSLVTRSTNDVTQVRMLITMGLQMLIKAPMMSVWAIINISGKRIEWSIATIVAVGILFTMLAIILMLVIPKFSKMQILTDNINRITRENLIGLPVIRAYNSEEYQQHRFEEANKKLVKTQVFTSQAASVMMPTMSLVMNGLTLSIFWIGAYLINNTSILSLQQDIFSNSMVFSSYSVIIVQAFMQIATVFIFLPRASVSAKRINEVMAVTPSIVSGDKEIGYEEKKGTIQFQNVSFAYPNSGGKVLNDVSFEITQGSTVAFIGSTGSGKTTIVNLMNRFYDTSDGQILVDGIDIKLYKLQALYNKIGLVPQKAVMFDGTVATNIAFGKDEYEIEKVDTALQISQGKDFVYNMQGQLDAEIARGGSNVSGGQKQRLSIARAVFKQPEILIFDDSFSALDYKTDRAVRAAIKNQINDITRVIVAQRIGTIRDADKIIVLDQGRVVGIGTHTQLMKSCEVYQEIAHTQLSEEELCA